MNILGIETSCDETAAAVVADGRRVLSNVVFSQIDQHRPYGGVVPEVASRCHVERLPGILREAVESSRLGWGDLDAVAVTCGPGLASALLVGVAAAKALALRLERPLIAVNHLAGHLESVFLGEGVPDGLAEREGLALLVSGGHTSLVQVRGRARPRLVGQTLDDAAGEALDKGAKLLHLGYPGGPVIERVAVGGNRSYVRFPRGPLAAPGEVAAGGLDRDLCFSFSGLKTALLYRLRDHPEDSVGEPMRDLVASYQEAVVDALIGRVRLAATRLRPAWLACAGGVARNRRLRERLGETAEWLQLPLLLARPEFCTDNAAMIAAAAGSGRGCRVDPPSALDVRPSFPLGVEDAASGG